MANHSKNQFLFESKKGKYFEFLYFAKEIIKKSKVELFLVNDKYQLAKYIKHNIYGNKIVIGMGAGSISSWMREMPKFL